MSRDQHSGSPEGRGSSEGRINRPELLGLDPDQVEAARFAEILATSERGDTPELDPLEDPALASLTHTVGTLRASFEAATARASFDSFHQRSRSRALAATPRPRLPRTAVAPARRSLHERWNGLFTSISAAAAASVATLIVTGLAIGSGSSSVPITVTQVASAPERSVSAAILPPLPERPRVNLTALSINDQIRYYVELVGRLDALSIEGLPADEGLLRDLADTGATVKRTIQKDPNVSGADAFLAMHTAYRGQQSLNTATVAGDGDAQALVTAQETAEDAYVTAAQYLSEPNRLPSAEDAARALSAATPGTAASIAASGPIDSELIDPSVTASEAATPEVATAEPTAPATATPEPAASEIEPAP